MQNHIVLAYQTNAQLKALPSMTSKTHQAQPEIVKIIFSSGINKVHLTLSYLER